MARGDHIFVRRSLLGGRDGNHMLSFTHHGIDMGDKTIIHLISPSLGKKFEGGPRIERISMRDFAGGSPKVYALNYKALGLSSDDPDLVLKRAESKIGAAGYNPVTSNCEHFATWCKTGKSSSYQVERIKSDLFSFVEYSFVTWNMPFLLPFLGYSKKYTPIPVD